MLSLLYIDMTDLDEVFPHVKLGARNQGISNHDIDLVKLGQLGPPTIRAN